VSRKLLNCWIVALWLWLTSLFNGTHRYFWTRESYSFKGRVLHAGVAQGVAWKTLSIVELVPNKHDFPSFDNFLFLFRGRYRVWRFRVEEVKRFDTEAEALEFSQFGAKQNGC